VENTRAEERHERPGFGGTVALEAEQLERIARRAAEIAVAMLATASPYLSIPEAAAFLRARRQRVDDLLSQGRLTRVKEGARTLVRRAELEAYLRGEPTGRLAAGCDASLRVRRVAPAAGREAGMRRRASRDDS
jgi:excisionase family DNA binding protein